MTESVAVGMLSNPATAGGGVGWNRSTSDPATAGPLDASTVQPTRPSVEQDTVGRRGGGGWDKVGHCLLESK